jgi:hypothetical protein
MLSFGMTMSMLPSSPRHRPHGLQLSSALHGMVPESPPHGMQLVSLLGGVTPPDAAGVTERAGYGTSGAHLRQCGLDRRLDRRQARAPGFQVESCAEPEAGGISLLLSQTEPDGIEFSLHEQQETTANVHEQQAKSSPTEQEHVAADNPQAHDIRGSDGPAADDMVALEYGSFIAQPPNSAAEFESLAKPALGHARTQTHAQNKQVSRGTQTDLCHASPGRRFAQHTRMQHSYARAVIRRAGARLHSHRAPRPPA